MARHAFTVYLAEIQLTPFKSRIFFFISFIKRAVENMDLPVFLQQGQ